MLLKSDSERFITQTRNLTWLKVHNNKQRTQGNDTSIKHKKQIRLLEG